MKIYKTGVDIIIPAYNAASTIEKTLYSIAIQKNMSDFNVYIIDDNSSYDYSNQVNKFKNYYQITALKLSKNMGPGYARQYGLENSNREYIIFMDSDDYFYSPYSLYKLYNAIRVNNNEFVISDFYSEKNGVYELKRNNYSWLHGKIYSRKFIEENKIKFNGTRENEDVGFNCLMKFYKPKTYLLKEVTYMYTENMNSITRINNFKYSFDGIKSFAMNVELSVVEAIKRKIDLHLPIYTCFHALVDLYCYYIIYYKRSDVSKITEWGIKLKNIYDEYKEEYLKDINFEEKVKCIKKQTLKPDQEEECTITFKDFEKMIEELKYDRYNNTSLQ